MATRDEFFKQKTVCSKIGKEMEARRAVPIKVIDKFYHREENKREIVMDGKIIKKLDRILRRVNYNNGEENHPNKLR
jgi:hypothetical protein